MSLRDLLAVFKAGDVGSLPVVESVGSRRVVGIVEQRDLLRTLHLSRNTV
jgi:CBS domain-containing protein